MVCEARFELATSPFQGARINQTFPLADIDNMFLERTYKTLVPVSRIELEYEPYQDSTLPLCYTGMLSASGWNRTNDSSVKSRLQYHFATEAWRRRRDSNSHTLAGNLGSGQDRYRFLVTSP